MAGRQQDRNYYRVYFEYEYSASLAISLIFALFLFWVALEMAKTFSEPVIMGHVASVAMISYLFGTVVLWQTESRRKFFFCVIKYSFLYLFYAKVYPYNQHMLPTMAYYGALFNKALFHLNNFSIQHDRLNNTLANGLGEIVALSIVDNL